MGGMDEELRALVGSSAECVEKLRTLVGRPAGEANENDSLWIKTAFCLKLTNNKIRTGS